MYSMNIYFINMAFILILGFFIFITGSGKRKKKLYVIVSFTSIFLISGLRGYTVGTDTVNYQQLFILVSNVDFSNIFVWSRTEPGYLLLTKILSIVTIEPQAITILNSAIIVFGIALFVFYNSDNVCISTFLFLATFYFCASLNISRQFIAVALICNSFYFFKRGKIKTFIAIVLLASLFHISSIVFIFAIFLKHIKPKAISFILITLISFAISLIVIQFNYILMSLLSHYEVYIGTSYFLEKSVRGAIIIWFCQLCLACFSIYFISKDSSKMEKAEKEELFYLSVFMVFSVTIGIIGTKIYIFNRISNYFGIFMIILIPKILNKFKNFSKLFYLLLIFLMTLYYYYMLNTGTEGVVPYKFFWVN